MEPLRFEEYEELLRKAGVRRSQNGTLVFDQAVSDEAAATALEFRDDDDDPDRCVPRRWPQRALRPFLCCLFHLNTIHCLTYAHSLRSVPRLDADVPQPLAPPVFAAASRGAATLRKANAGEAQEEGEESPFAWEADLELVAGEVDHHANMLKGAVLVRASLDCRALRYPFCSLF
jgi:hypothetical protein